MAPTRLVYLRICRLESHKVQYFVERVTANPDDLDWLVDKETTHKICLAQSTLLLDSHNLLPLVVHNIWG